MLLFIIAQRPHNGHVTLRKHPAYGAGIKLINNCVSPQTLQVILDTSSLASTSLNLFDWFSYFTYIITAPNIQHT